MSAPHGRRRPQTPAEERANVATHALGLVGALVGLPFVVQAAAQQGGPLGVFGGVVFSLSAILMYATSTTYHAWPVGRAKVRLRTLDHTAIYLLIAGSYTPFTVGVLRGPWGWTLLVLIWAVAATGITLKAVRGPGGGKVSVWLYLGMGWLLVVAIKPMLELMPGWGFYWIAAGGFFYTAGVVFFVLDDRVRYFHAVWHLFVVAGTTCHFMAIWKYAW